LTPIKAPHANARSWMPEPHTPGQSPRPAVPRRPAPRWRRVRRDGLWGVFAPIVALLALAAVFGGVGWLLQPPYRARLLLVSDIGGVLAGLLGMLQLYRQSRGRLVANRELHDVEVQVSNIVESAMDPIVTIDADQRIIGFNAAAEQAFRWPREAVIGQPVDHLIPQRFRVAHREHIERFGLTGGTARRMAPHTVLAGLRADGQEFPIEASISQHEDHGGKRYTAILRDVSERVRAEQALSSSEARLRGILDSAMDAIITIDERQHIVLFNRAAEAMFGCPRDEAIGAPIAWFIPERERAAHLRHVAQFGESGTVSRRMGGALRIVTGLRRNGGEFPIDASISQIIESGTKYYTVILRDVTARVQAEEALRQSRNELRELGAAAHTTREQEKSRIARELHDELGQALTMLQMDVAWFREKIPADAPGFSIKLDRMEGLLKRTIGATRRIASDLRPLVLDDLGLVPALEWLVQNFTQRTGVPCALVVDDPQLELPGEQSTAVFRVVQESLTNIAKHAQASQVKVEISRDAEMLAVRIEDDGVGFATEAPRKPGSLGLFGLRERASLLSGEATIVSTPGKGTTVQLRLPLSAPAGEA
jgi:PAS domain S-box-containing protein